MLVRSVRHRRLWHLPEAGARPNKRYGAQVPKPYELWRSSQGWQAVERKIRGRLYRFRYKLYGPVLRRKAWKRPLMMLIIGGDGRRRSKKRRRPMVFLTDACLRAGKWVPVLPAKELIFWAWQRWELEVAHRELKMNFGLGDKRAWQQTSAVLSVQWSVWVYGVLVLAAYQSWGLCGGVRLRRRWWSGSGRWGFDDLWRSVRYLAFLELLGQLVRGSGTRGEDLGRWLLGSIRGAGRR